VGQGKGGAKRGKKQHGALRTPSPKAAGTQLEKQKWEGRFPAKLERGGRGRNHETEVHTTVRGGNLRGKKRGGNFCWIYKEEEREPRNKKEGERKSLRRPKSRESSHQTTNEKRAEFFGGKRDTGRGKPRERRIHGGR